MQDLWQVVTTGLQDKLSTPGFKTFISSIKLASFEEGVLTINVPNDFVMNWVRERCELFIQEIFQEKFKRSIVLSYNVTPNFNFEADSGLSETEVVAAGKTPALAAASGNNGNPFNPKYTFDTFVVGHGNRFAQAATLAVAEAPAKAYNPLFIYGGAGLGKTHLMQATAQRALALKPRLKIVYIKTEAFVNEMIESIREGQNRMIQFRNKYRTVDMLLIDDIQFLIGKERTQEEFFHTFNALHEANKQIVLNSDRPPKELSNLEERLKSRFAWGLITDIQPPELETRIAILRKKAETDNLTIPEDVLIYVAKQIPSNVRDLEGAINRIIAHSSLTGEALSVDFAAETLKNLFTPQDKYITISVIKQVVAEYFNIDIEELSAKVRTKEIAFARQMAMYLAKEMTPSSLAKIGSNFGGRDHTTVLHACDKIKETVKTDSSIADLVKNLRQDVLTR